MENVDSNVGEDNLFNRAYTKQVTGAARSLFKDMCQVSGIKKCSDLRAGNLNKPSITKAVLLEWLETAVYILDDFCIPLMHFAVDTTEELDELKSDKISDQKKIIELQGQIIDKKEAEIRSVHETVEKELKTYSSVLEKNCSEALAPRKIAAAMKNVADKEDRTANIVVFGIPEEENEAVDSKVTDMLEHLDEKPTITLCTRIGKQKPGTRRPIRFRVQNSSTVFQILKKAKLLKEIEGYESTYLSPDRTMEERTIRKKLVEQLKHKRSNDPDNLYYIRGGEIVCVSKT